MGKELDGPVCLKHPDRLAVAHSCVCRRPVCKECLVEEDGFKCCSRACLKMAKESTRRTADVVDRKRRTESKLPIRAFIRWIVIIALCIGAWVYRGNIKNLWNEYVRGGKSKIQRINQENVQKDHERRNRKMNEFERDGL